MEIEFNIDEILKEKHLSIARAARLCNLSYPTLYSIVRNRQSRVDLKTLAQLSEFLQVGISDLFRDKENKKAPDAGTSGATNGEA